MKKLEQMATYTPTIASVSLLMSRQKKERETDRQTDRQTDRD